MFFRHQKFTKSDRLVKKFHVILVCILLSLCIYKNIVYIIFFPNNEEFFRICLKEKLIFDRHTIFLEFRNISNGSFPQKSIE